VEKFPVYKNHDNAICFNCNKKFTVNAYICTYEDLYAPGDGQYRQKCENCRLFTYYDVLTVEESANAENEIG